jgi:hypothetical protein
MIADDLATSIAAAVAEPGCRVLDPFCGTARTLLATDEFRAKAVGLDVNPLALLVAQAKSCHIDVRVLERIAATMVAAVDFPLFNLEQGRKTEWFSSTAKVELCQIIAWLNGLGLSRDYLLPMAAILSATARDVSYCRNHQWKLHRMPTAERKTFHPSAWNVFSRRLRRFTEEARLYGKPRSRYSFYFGDARNLRYTLREHGEAKPFDVVITSPPYGDSRTTLGYGGMSSICLGVLQHLKGLDVRYVSPSEIDNRCLGGRENRIAHLHPDIAPYWRGGIDNPARDRVLRYLSHLFECCSEISTVLGTNAQAVFVVARRNAGKRRLYLEKFVRDAMACFGFTLKSLQTRVLINKRLPWFVNPDGACGGGRRVATMREEFVITLRR